MSWNATSSNFSLASLVRPIKSFLVNPFHIRFVLPSHSLKLTNRSTIFFENFYSSESRRKQPATSLVESDGKHVYEAMALLEIKSLKKEFRRPDGSAHLVVSIREFSLAPRAQVALSGD